MRSDPCAEDNRDAEESETHANRIMVVGAHHDVVHVARKSRDDNQRDVHHEEGKEAEHGEEMDGTRGLAAAEEPRVPREAVNNRGGHGNSGGDGQRTEDENDGEIGNLLQRVIAIEAVRLRRQIKRGIVDEGAPGLEENQRRSWNDALPLVRAEEQSDENDAGGDEAMHVNKMPNPRDANGMPVSGRTDQRRDVTSIIFCRPEAVAGNLERRETNPLGAGSTAIIEVQTGMINQDGQTTANQEHDEEKIEKMAVAHPNGEAVGSREIVGIDLRNRRKRGQSSYGKLDPRSGN